MALRLDPISRICMPVEVRVGERRVRVEMADGEGRVEVGREDWAVDPDSWLLMVRE